MSPNEYLEALLSLPGLVGPAVSPDGRWVAWTWYRTGPYADVYAAPTDGSTAPVRLTDTPENTHVVSWAPDSRSLLVAQDHDGDERDQLFRVSPERPLEMEPLTEANPSFFLRGGELHPNGRWLVYGANFNAETGKEIEATWIYRHDLETGERKALARPLKASFARPRLNHTGTHVLYLRMDLHPAGRQVWLVDIEGTEDREILNFGAEVKVSASWFPDSRRVLVLADTGTYRRLGVWDMADASLRWVIDDPSRNLEGAYVPLGSDRVVVLEVREARVRASLLDVDSGDELPFLQKTTPADLVPLAPTPDGAWVVQSTSSTRPTDVERLSFNPFTQHNSGSLTRLDERTPLRREHFTAARDFRWKSGDGLEIQGWLYQVSGPAKGTIVYVHGGPTAHSQDRLNNQIAYFNFLGFNVLDPNYRGSTGFSQTFREAIKEDGWGGREQDDIRTGIEALIAEGIAEPGKVGITGTSYGGYSSWCAITHCPPEVVAASAPICGMTDLVVDYETTRPDLRPYSEEMMGGSPAQVPERYRRGSPIHFVQNIRGKLLIIQGLQDPNVSPENVRAVREALDQAGVAYEVLAFEDEGHGISKPKNQKVLYQRLAEFFAGAFGGESLP